MYYKFDYKSQKSTLIFWTKWLTLELSRRVTNVNIRWRFNSCEYII